MVKLWQQWLVRGAIALTTTSILIILWINPRFGSCSLSIQPA
ncbi:hypothetical protein [Adonisia turfae]|nr:hypothetical protein [Adonisia turfae]